MENQVTRFDVRETEDGDEIRLFNKRKKLFAFGVDDIVLEDWQEKLQAYINEKPRTDKECEEFLTTEADETGDEEEDARGDIIPQKYREIYGVEQNCGDEVAVIFTGYVTNPRVAGQKYEDGGLDREKLAEVAADNGLAAKLDEYTDRGLNGGLLRMNIGNVLRGKVRRGEMAKIGEKVWEEDTTNPKHPKAKEAAKAAKTKAVIAEAEAAIAAATDKEVE